MPETLAVIKTGGKQYLVSPGDKIKVEKLPYKEGEEIIFDQVLLLKSKDEVKVGKPILEKIKVKAKVLAQGKGEKIIILKHKRRKRHKVKKGHRQPYTEVEILSIENQ